ncbi:MAG: hypothetical protein KDA65_17865 [Planctomycetaceae bacterium]|nr:hypothetical protein [Planctomycetaceae bacterium]
MEFGSISAAIWSKQISSADGQPRDSWTVNLSRSYRDGKSTKRTHVLFPEHLLTASMALLKAWEFIEQKSKERTEASA